MKTEKVEKLKNSKYLNLLSRQFPTIQDSSREIINLEAILNLPKGTEHFLSDLHGEDEAFLHFLKNGSGVIKSKIEDIFASNVVQKEKNKLATLIYYPREVIKKEAKEQDKSELLDWYKVTLHRLILVCREVSSKYTRSKVRKSLPTGFEYIIEELLHEQENDTNKYEYYDKIIKTIVDIGQAQPFIIAISELIQCLAIDHLHIIGDIYDRGKGPHIILDELIKYHSVDIQWGNHDIVWMGACSGSLLCIANAIRISARYGNLDVLEEAYGINLLPLAKFAIDTYDEVEDTFMPKNSHRFSNEEAKMIGQIHKAITIILLKLEGQFIKRNPQYNLNNRLLLEKINYNNYTIKLDNEKEYVININKFQTINPIDSYILSREEMEIMLKLKFSFMNNEKLEKHVDFLFSNGSMYLVFNNNLLFHGCIPMDEFGNFAKVNFKGEDYSGKLLLDKFEEEIREIYGKRKHIVDESDLDIFWYLWTGENSTLFGKKTMKTFERYFIEDKETHEEVKNAYYTYCKKSEYCEKILKEFGLDNEKAKIINGHVPVKVKKGENPVKAQGKLIVIDGGLSRAYQEVTGIAGYTLIYNSHGMLLAAHEPFISAEHAIENNKEIVSELSVLEASRERLRVRDTDIGKKIEEDINDLKLLLEAYQVGAIKQLK